MSEKMPQTYANYTRFDPPFHFFVIPVAAVTFFVMIWNAFQKSFSFTAVWLVVAALAGLVAAFKIRLYALRVQDRLIRLEERLRLSTALPEPLRARIGELNLSQLIALRFASDAELPALVDKTLAGNLPAAEIKKAITNWRPDYFRV
jgi:Family of unknown function (DUF6526)